jgi:cytochrome b561
VRDTTSAIAPPAYSVTARVLHWLTAALVLAMIPLGIVIAQEWGGPLQERLYNLHRSVGALLILIILARLAYRLTHPPLPLTPDVSVIQQRAAHMVHWTLYVLLVVQPFVGWVATSAYRAPMPMFGLFNLPPISPVNRPLSEQLFVVHRALGIVIAIVAAVHIGAALYHHFVRRDRVLMRMITG